MLTPDFWGQLAPAILVLQWGWCCSFAKSGGDPSWIRWVEDIVAARSGRGAAHYDVETFVRTRAYFPRFVTALSAVGGTFGIVIALDRGTLGVVVTPFLGTDLRAAFETVLGLGCAVTFLPSLVVGLLLLSHGTPKALHERLAQDEHQPPDAENRLVQDEQVYAGDDEDAPSEREHILHGAKPYDPQLEDEVTWRSAKVPDELANLRENNRRAERLPCPSLPIALMSGRRPILGLIVDRTGDETGLGITTAVPLDPRDNVSMDRDGDLRVYSVRYQIQRDGRFRSGLHRIHDEGDGDMYRLDDVG